MFHCNFLVRIALFVGEREAAVVTNDQGKQTRVQESKIEEKLAMKDKQLAETRTLVKNLKKREEQLLEK